MRSGLFRSGACVQYTITRRAPSRRRIAAKASSRPSRPIRSVIRMSSGKPAVEVLIGDGRKVPRRVGRAVVRAPDRLSILHEPIDVEAGPLTLRRHAHERDRAARTNEVDRQLDGLDETDALEHVIRSPALMRIGRRADARCAPARIASSSFASEVSMAITGLAPWATAPMTALRPTPPRPITTTDSPACTRAVFRTAPIPVVTAQPMSAAISGGVRGSTLIAADAATTCCSPNVPMPLYAPTASPSGPWSLTNSGASR